MTDLFLDAVIGDVASASDYNTNFTLVQNSLSDLGPYVVSGLALSAGAGLAVTVAAGVASIGGRITASGSFSIAGLTDATTNHLYLRDNGTGTSNTSGTQPADTVKLGTATTSGGAVTSTNILRDSGRQAKVRTESLVPGGPAAGNPASINLAAWAAAAANSVTVYGTLPAGALPAIAFDDLSDVTLTSQARGDIVYRGASAWLNLVHGTSGQFLKTLGTGADPAWATLGLADLTGDLTLTSVAQGDIIYRGASVWDNLAHGTSGQYLKTQGAGANPIWADAPTEALSGLSDVTLSGTAQGNVLYRGATAWNNLAVGTAGQVLISGGAAANPSWSSSPTLAALTLGGDLTLSTHDLITDTSTGTRIGTGTTQKLGFFGSTPVVQQTGVTDLRTGLINLGFFNSTGAMPLNLNGGALVAGTIASSGGFLGSGSACIFARLAFTFAADANETLSSANMAYPMLDVQNGVITAQRDILVPANAGGLYMVINRNTYGVNIRVGANTGIVVASQRSAIIAFPGGGNGFRLTPDTVYTS